MSPVHESSVQNTLPERIVLTGFMGAGKSTVGRQLAAHLSWEFIDLDDEIVRAEGAPIIALFSSFGEPAFREFERAALEHALLKKQIVLALGGGAMEFSACRGLLSDSPGTLVIYLEAPMSVLLARCKQQHLMEVHTPRRPVLEDEAGITERFLRRKPFYETADWHVETSGRTTEELALEIADRCKSLQN